MKQLTYRINRNIFLERKWTPDDTDTLVLVVTVVGGIFALFLPWGGM